MQVGEMIRRAAVLHRDAPALTEGERTLSFREFDAATDRLGNAVLDLGLHPGDRVGVLLPNSIDCLITYYSLAKNGMVRVPLNSRDPASSHAYKLADSGARAVIHDGRDGLDAEIQIGPDRLVDLIRDGGPTPCRRDRSLTDPYRLGYTGGTTGLPKAVTLTTAGEIAEVAAFLIDLVPDIRRGDTFLHAAPIAHASGAFFLPGLLKGARALIMPKFDVEGFLTLAEREAASMTFLVPTQITMVLESPNIDRAHTCFRRIAYGASSIAPSVLERAMHRFGPVFAQTYGQSESPMVITFLPPEEHHRIGSCGRPFTMVEVHIFDDHDRPLPPGEVGEIVCRGPQTMSHYWNKPEETAQVFRNGWLHTGDLGRMDEDGYFYILDRKNDLLISGGYNVYPREIEDVLLAYDGVVEAAVIGVPDEKWGDRVQAVIAARPGLDVGRLMAHCADHVANYKRPRQIDVWPELPKSPAGKILRREVRSAYLAQQTPVSEKRS